MINNGNFSQDQMDQMTKTAAKQAEAFSNMNKAGFDAWMQSANIFMDGTQNLFKSMTDMANAARDNQSQAAKKFMSCKTLNDMTETSTKIAQETMEQTMTNATNLSEKTVKLSMEAIEPINDQLSKGMQNIMDTAKQAKKAA